MSYSQQSKRVFETKSLKQIYENVEQRKRYVQKKLSQCRLSNAVLVRIEPHPKTKLVHLYITLTMDKKTKISQIYGHLHKKILKLSVNQSLFLFFNKNMVILNHTAGELIEKSQQEDGILYLNYAQNDPFGFG